MAQKHSNEPKLIEHVIAKIGCKYLYHFLSSILKLNGSNVCSKHVLIKIIKSKNFIKSFEIYAKTMKFLNYFIRITST